MKHLLSTSKRMGAAIGFALMLSPVAVYTSCTEDIDDSNFVISNNDSAADYIDKDTHFSMIKQILENVRMGRSPLASSIYTVLTTRGNYTVFLPTNDAVQNFLNENDLTSIAQMDSIQLDMIAKNCIIDCKDNSALETPEFPIAGTFRIPTLSDRLLSCKLDSSSYYVINETSHVIHEDIKVSNGVLHVVDAVIAPSVKTLDNQIAEAFNTQVFSYLLKKTTWADSLHEEMDASYENSDRPETWSMPRVGKFTWAPHRYLGYTAFVEPDSIYERELGVVAQYDDKGKLTNGEDFLEKVARFAEKNYSDYSSGAAKADYSHPDNLLNQFVAYHILKGKIPYNKFAPHYNEFGYVCGDAKNPQTVNTPINVWSYFTTMGKHRGLMKVTQVGDAGFEHDIEHHTYINRMSTYANGPEDDYHETGVIDGMYGACINPHNGDYDNNSINGYYYTINQLLVYSPKVRNTMSRRRIRIDVANMLPEMQSNGFRSEVYMRFENGYFDNIINSSPRTAFCYLMSQAHWQWSSYQGDEFMGTGLYDFTLRLPPVPADGTYEIRYGTSLNPARGMCQMYFGEDPDRLEPTGLPFDLRQEYLTPRPGIPWQEDTDDWILNLERDKFLRNKGYMKGPKYYTTDNGKGDMPVRLHPNVLRHIVVVADLKADKTYYLRFKSALKKFDSELTMDYFEFASKAVFNGPRSEDIW